MPKKLIKDYKNPKKSIALTFSITHTNPKVTTYYSQNHSQINQTKPTYFYRKPRPKEKRGKKIRRVGLIEIDKEREKDKKEKERKIKEINKIKKESRWVECD